MSTKIEVSHVGKRYLTQSGDVVDALADVSLTVQERQFLVVVGPSGCGKSTLLKILAGLVAPTTGQVIVNGTPINGPRPDIGIVFQDPILFPWRTVLDNTLLPVDARGGSRQQYRSRAIELLGLVGLADFASKYPYELSGGMQQRNALSRALLLDPSILLMDEPFGALDAMTRDQMNLELQRIWEQSRKTIFLITHSISEAVFLADRLLVMSARPGRIVDRVDVDLPRPRHLAMIGSPRFGELMQRVRASLEGASWRT